MATISVSEAARTTVSEPGLTPTHKVDDLGEPRTLLKVERSGGPFRILHRSSSQAYYDPVLRTHATTG